MIVSKDPFKDPKYLLYRAQLHATEFKRQVQAFNIANTCTMLSEVDPQTRESVYYLELVETIPIDLSGILFDACNNLRSALDQTLFVLHRGTRNFASFPINVLDSTFRKRTNGIDQRLVSFIEALKPHNGGNRLLTALDAICNTNKHATILEFALVPRCDIAIRMEFPGGAPWAVGRPITSWDTLNGKGEIGRAKEGVTFYTPEKYAVTVGLVEIKGIGHKTAVSLLDEMFSQVQGIIWGLECEALRIGWLERQPV